METSDNGFAESGFAVVLYCTRMVHEMLLGFSFIYVHVRLISQEVPQRLSLQTSHQDYLSKHCQQTFFNVLFPVK